MAAQTFHIPGQYRRVRYNWSTVDGQPVQLLRDDTLWEYGGVTVTAVKPDYVKSRKPTGWLMPKAYSRSYSHYRDPVGTAHAYQSIVNGSPSRLHTVWVGDIPGSSSIGPYGNYLAIPPDVYDQLVIKALLKLKDTRINIGVALGEASSTARGLGQGWKQIQGVANVVGNSLTRVATAGRSFKKGQWKKAARQLGVPPPKSAPSNWLALQYGWLPLLSDIKGATDELLGLSDAALVQTVKASYRDRDKGNYYYPSGKYVNLVQRNAESGMFLRLDYEPANNLLQTASRVGLTNPLEIAWELVPFSFVVDWALPLGNWLSALDATFGWNFKSGSVSSLSRVSCGITCSHPNGDIRDQASYSGSMKKYSFNRSVVGVSPFPRFPNVKNPLSLGHAANGLSLLATVFSGRKT